MLSQAENIRLLFDAVPVTPDTLENSGAVVNEVGHYPDFSLRQRDELVIDKGI
jgi:hypothetical protein